jgi:hypothetical protein
VKLNIIELRDMVAQAVRQTVREAKKAKLPAERSEESVIAQRERQVRGLPGYAHSSPLDMSKPLGKRNRARRQGASNIGNWTSESRGRPATGGLPARGQPGMAQRSEPTQTPAANADLRQLRQQFDRLLFTLRREKPEISYELDQIARVFNDFVQAVGGGAQQRSEAAVRKLIGMVVDEEVRVARRR